MYTWAEVSIFPSLNSIIIPSLRHKTKTIDIILSVYLLCLRQKIYHF